MSAIFSMFRRSLEEHGMVIIATIQANANMYDKPIYETIRKNPYIIVKSIEGGVKPAQRSSFVSIIVMNDKGQRGLYIYKAKGTEHKLQGYILPYGGVDSSTLQIAYGPQKTVEEFYGVNGGDSPQYVAHDKGTKGR